MGCSGFLDWHRLERTHPWTVDAEHHTSVFAFWCADYSTPQYDLGLRILKRGDGQHPDWFIHSDTADNVLAAYIPANALVSPNFRTVFHDGAYARPLLGAVLLGTSDATFRSGDSMWWASFDDLTRRGKRLVADLNRLWERRAFLITFVDRTSDEDGVPEAPSTD